MGVKFNDSLAKKQAIVKFYTMEYRKCGNSNSKNDSRPCMGASAIPESVDFMAFAVNVKTIAPKKKLYQSGHAIWWSDMPMAVYSFLESYDFSGKTIIPFCTHEGSGISSTESSIAEVCPDTEVLEGLGIRGSIAQNSQDEAKETVDGWLEEIGTFGQE